MSKKQEVKGVIENPDFARLRNVLQNNSMFFLEQLKQDEKKERVIKK